MRRIVRYLSVTFVHPETERTIARSKVGMSQRL